MASIPSDELVQVIATGTEEPFTLGPLTCQPKQRTRGLVPLARGSSGQELGIPVAVVHSGRPGPVLCVGAGIHGDEYDSMQAVRQVVEEIDDGEMSGILVAMPCINTAAFDAASRTSGIDHANLNRIFPGDATGSYSLRLAATFVEEIVPRIDAFVDLHTGGTFGEIAPLAIVQQGFEELATGLGLSIGHEIIWRGGAWGGTARAATLAAGKPAVTVEAGGGTCRDEIVDLHRRSIFNVLRAMRMLPGAPARRERYTAVLGSFARSANGGFFVPHSKPGDHVKAGELIARIVDHLGSDVEEVVAPNDGIVLWQRRLRTIRPGEETVIFGTVDGEIVR